MAIATLSIDLVAKLATLERDMGKAAHIAEKNAKKMDDAFSTVSRTLSTLGSGLSVGAFALMVRNVADTGDQLQKLSTKTGEAVEELSKLQYAASLSDVGNEELSAGLIKLNRVMGDAAEGSKEATAALARFGIVPDSGLSSIEAFQKIADRVKATGDETKIASGLNDVFGKSFATLIPLLKGGSEELKSAGDELERMGGVMSGDLAKSSEEFNDNITRLQTQMSALKLETIGPLVPLLSQMAEEFLKSSEGADKLSSSGSVLKTTFETLGVLGANVGYVFKQVGTEIGGIAAQAAALAKGNFAQVGYIRDAMVEDAKAARAEIDAISDRLLTTSAGSSSSGYAGRSRVTQGEGITSSPTTSKKTSTKKQKEDVDALTSSAEAYAKAIQSIDSAESAAVKSTLTLNGAQESLLDLMMSPYWESMPQAWKDIAIAETDAANAGIEAANSQRRLNELLAATPTAELEKAREDMELLADALKRGEINADQFSEAASQRLGLSDQIKEGTDEIKKQKSAAEELGMSFSSAFEDAIVSGKEFSDVLEGIGQDILRIMVRKNITEPLAGAVSGFDFSSLFSANADGGVYNSPSLSAYSGGVYSSPKLFKFASGAGVFGEAGPEAIMPLKRGADGKLGVAGGASNVTVNVIEAPGSKSAGTTQTTQGDNGEQVITVFVEKIKNALIQDVGSGGSFASKLEGQYALNRAAGAWR